MMGKKISPDTRREIEALSREGLSQKEIAARAGVCVDTVRTIERQSLGLRQPAKRTRGPLSQREKRTIAKLFCEEGKLIMDICQRMRLARGTVAAYIKREGLVPGLPERKLLAMKRDGWTQPEIARKLRLNRRRVFEFFRVHGFARPRYRRFQPTTKQLIEIIDLAMAGNDSVKSIAKKVALPYDPTLKLVHKIRRCSKFLPTAKLDSYLPMMRHRDQVVPRATEEEVMLRLLHHARAVCLEAHVSPDPARLVTISIAVAAKLYLRESGGARIGYTDAEYARMLAALGPRFESALDTLTAAEGSMVH